MVSLFDFWQVVAWYESQQAQAIIFDMFLFFKDIGQFTDHAFESFEVSVFFKMVFMFLVARSRYDMLIHVDSLYKSI